MSPPLMNQINFWQLFLKLPDATFCISTYNLVQVLNTWSHKMVKHSQTIRPQ